MKVVFTNTPTAPRPSAAVAAAVQRLLRLNLGFWDGTSSIIHASFHHYRCSHHQKWPPNPDHHPNPAGDVLHLDKKGACLDGRRDNATRQQHGDPRVTETPASAVRMKSFGSSCSDETLLCPVSMWERGKKRRITAHLAAACLQRTNEPLSSFLWFLLFLPRRRRRRRI